MCKSRRELAQEQLDLMEIIRAKSNINMVTCGHCGTILLHDLDRDCEKDPLVCFSCKRDWTDLCDCPDYWYEGCLENGEFDENEPTKEIEISDVIEIAKQLKLNPSIGEIKEILNRYDAEAKADPTATWNLIVENLLYNCVTPK